MMDWKSIIPSVKQGGSVKRYGTSLPRVNTRTASVSLPLRSSELALETEIRKSKVEVEELNRWSSTTQPDTRLKRQTAETRSQYMNKYTDIDSLVLQRRSRKTLPRTAAVSASEEQLRHILEISQRRIERQTQGQQLKDLAKFSKRLEEDLAARSAQLQKQLDEVLSEREHLRTRNTLFRDQLSEAHLSIKSARTAANRLEMMLKSKVKSVRMEDLSYIFSKRSASQLDLFNREQEYQMTVARLTEEITGNSGKAMELDNKTKELREKLREVHRKQVEHYKGLLAEGVDTRSEGLAWVVQALWRLGEKVEVEMFPRFLDLESIHVIIFIAQKRMEIDDLTAYVSELQTTRRMSISSLVSRGNIQGRLSVLKNPITSSQPSTDSPAFPASDPTPPLLPIAEDPLSSTSIETRITGLKSLIHKTQSQELRRLTRDCFMNNLEEKVKTGAHQILAAVAGAETLSRQMAAITKEQKDLAEDLRKTKTFSFSGKS